VTRRAGLKVMGIRISLAGSCQPLQSLPAVVASDFRAGQFLPCSRHFLRSAVRSRRSGPGVIVPGPRAVVPGPSPAPFERRLGRVEPPHEPCCWQGHRGAPWSIGVALVWWLNRRGGAATSEGVGTDGSKERLDQRMYPGGVR
jgi:hypothetical protein